ncbi:VanZ family protein [Hominifimenecus sp. rT4P-3]|uniref:VanZ family protein n=1 Tax=Hominifimenecus sp. rT4P-3 TaxID=3242979 RepID=UPI003DA6C1CD
MKQKEKKTAWIWFFAMIIVMGIIFYFSSQSGDQSSRVSNGFFTFLLRLPPMRWTIENTPVFEILPLRKWGHLSVYFLLGITSFGFMHQVVGSNGRAAMGAGGICFLYACSDEFHQLFVPGRAGQWKDVGIDSIGYVLGIGIWLLVLYGKHRRARKFIEKSREQKL